MLTYADRQYFDDCIQDQLNLMVPVLLKRCISISRDSEYPDDPPKQGYKLTPLMADLREVSLQESSHSGGVLIMGDNVIWIPNWQLRGPEDILSNKDDPGSVADVLIIHNAEWTIVGKPLVGRLKDATIVGCQAFIRRRRGGNIDPTTEGAGDV